MKVLCTARHFKRLGISKSHHFSCSPALFYACIVGLWQQVAYQHLVLD